MSEQAMLTEAGLQHLNKTSPWVKFIAVLAFVGTTIMLLMGLVFLVMGLGAGNPSFMAGGLLYLVITLIICLIPGILMWRYSKAIGRIPDDGQPALEDALARQKSFWKYMGIYTIVILVITVLAMLFAIIYGSISHQ
ncbi:MAG: hypothetical protein KGK44_10870 [Gammaproteobacteria bacterium]|nr:hypothetical protein [Gammaproteobacteria bacterium]